MDLRVEYIFKQEMSGDTSFQDKGGFLGTLFPTKYDSTDMRETWHRGIKYGIEIGLRRSTLEAQKIDINTNTICLLYTSPSPRDRQKSRMPSSA